MRSWGSPVVTEDSLPVNIAEAVEEVGKKKKKKSKKGDKGGTGSKAGVNNGRAKSEGEVEVEMEEPEKKKRKRDESAVESATPVVASEKTLKRLKKNMSKLEKGGEVELVLADWLSKAGKGKEGDIDTAEVLKGLKVSLSDGKWILTA
jgi:cell growth-regulating nucleolar protein